MTEKPLAKSHCSKLKASWITLNSRWTLVAVSIKECHRSVSDSRLPCMNESSLKFRGIRQLSNWLCTGFGWDGLNFLHSSLEVLCLSSVVAHGFGYCWAVLAQCQGFLSNTPPTTLKVCKLEMDKRLAGGITGTTDPKTHRDIPCHMMSSLEIKVEGKKNDGRTFVVI